MFHLYRHFAANGDLLYIGQSISAIARLSGHKKDSAWFNQITRVEIEHFSTRETVLIEEKKAIINEHPIFNKTYSSDKNEYYFDDEEIYISLSFDWNGEEGVPNRKDVKTLSKLHLITQADFLKDIIYECNKMYEKLFEEKPDVSKLPTV